jgi:diguanylate cyclase
MLIKFKNKDSHQTDTAEMAAELRENKQKKEYFLLSVQVLLQFMKEFALDLKEINSDGFKKDISRLAENFSTENKLKSIESRFEKGKKRIDAFIHLQRKYLLDRENEFKDIIDILTRAMVTNDTANQEYNQKILKQSKKIEEITRLDDIKKLKKALIQEIEQIRETVREKESQDSTQLEILSKQVGNLSLELEKARSESRTDGMTGIYNRKAFDSHLDELVEKNIGSNAPFSLLMLDIDDFKKVNDLYGHQTGDRVILAITNKCRQSIRGEDFLARYGGEEFVIILPGASLENAIKKAEAICKSIASTRYYLDDVAGNPTLSVTVSIGVSSFQRADTTATVTQRADKALYAAKHRGKNCVLSEKMRHKMRKKLPASFRRR